MCVCVCVCVCACVCVVLCCAVCMCGLVHTDLYVFHTARQSLNHCEVRCLMIYVNSWECHTAKVALVSMNMQQSRWICIVAYSRSHLPRSAGLWVLFKCASLDSQQFLCVAGVQSLMLQWLSQTSHGGLSPIQIAFPDTLAPAADNWPQPHSAAVLQGGYIEPCFCVTTVKMGIVTPPIQSVWNVKCS